MSFFKNQNSAYNPIDFVDAILISTEITDNYNFTIL